MRLRDQFDTRIIKDSINVNLVQVEMPNGGRGSKRSEINLEKNLAKKSSMIRIQNKDEIMFSSSTRFDIAKI
jgi:hypothetical protein